MGQEIVYCAGCQSRLLGGDFEKGQAVRIGSNAYCLACAATVAPAEPAPSTSRSRASSSRMPAARSTQRRPMVAKRGGAGWVVGGGAAALGLVAVIVIGVTGRSDPPPAPPLPPRVAPPPVAAEIDPRRRDREEMDAALAALDRDLRELRKRGEFEKALALLEASRRKREGVEWEKAVDARLRDVSREAEKARPPPPAPAAEPGLVAWFKLDEGQGAAAADATGHGHAGRLVKGAAWVPGRMGSALRFDGTGYVTTPDTADLSLAGPLTLAAWIHLDKVDKDQRAIIEKWDAGGRCGYYLRLGSEGHLRLALADGAGPADLTGRLTIAANEWTHVAGVFDGSNIRLYVNGRLDRAGAVAKSPVDGTSLLSIGAAPSGGNRFVGAIDDVRVYGRALAEAEVAALAAGK